MYMVNITISKDNVLSSLFKYLSSMKTYSNFTPDMELIVYTDKTNNEFVAFETKQFYIGYSNKYYKVSSILSTDLYTYEFTFSDFYRYVENTYKCRTGQN